MNARTLASAVSMTLALTYASFAAPAPAGKKFSTPEKAVEAFVTAVRNRDAKALVSIFGKDSEALFISQDPVADENVGKQFLELYDAKHEIGPGRDGGKILIVGPDAWPLPIPLVNVGGKWAFDTAAGLEEVINRRVGRNELSAIQTCLAIGDAQREYYSVDRDGDGILEYAQHFRSTVGLKNGLFWPADEGELTSPLGQFVATASEEGYTGASSAYHGYHYKLLRSQSAAAPGGAYDYMAGDNQIGGFAVVAYPAAYGDSGVMTFAVSHSGEAYQRDLGEDTATAVLNMESFDPGPGWTKVSPSDLQALPRD